MYEGPVSKSVTLLGQVIDTIDTSVSVISGATTEGIVNVQIVVDTDNGTVCVSRIVV